ncbi:MAG: InlB B-repeat-containing protein [Clostridia bacterium]|nr:InlB B-repeat-containing protein [Clostridia bacterium]
MAKNTIEKAVRYIREPNALATTLNYSLKTTDLEVPSVFIGAQTVKYLTISFDDYDLGDFNREKGYATKGIRLTWTEKTMTQDKGDSLHIDRMDDEEAMANGIVRIANRYIDRVQAPAVDKYRLKSVGTQKRANAVNATFTSVNIVDKLLEGRKHLVNHHVNLDNTILYLSASADTILSKVSIDKGTLGLGNWNGNMEAKVLMFKEAKIIVVADDYLPDGVQAILLNPEVAPAMKKYSECEYFDKIPGFGGRRAQVDIGLYHDCFTYDELARGIVVFLKTSTTKHTITYAGGDGATGTAPMQDSVVAGTDITLAANSLTREGYTFVGWDDGSNLYAAGKTYSVPNANVTLTARWKSAA